jgi:hypothetical protein
MRRHYIEGHSAEYYELTLILIVFLLVIAVVLVGLWNALTFDWPVSLDVRPTLVPSDKTH